MNTKGVSGARTWLVPLLVFLLLAAGIVATGAFYYRSHERNYRSGMERQLSSIAELKVEELVLWRKERMGDGAMVFKNSTFTALVRRFFEKPEDADAERQLRSWIEKYPNSGYDRIRLLDTQGISRMSWPAGKLSSMSSVILQRLPEILRSGRVMLQDFYRNEYDQRIYLEVMVPILNDSDANRPLGVLALRIDPETYLYPFIKRWPAPSLTAETLLVRREGNEAIFLNELRFQTNTALNLRCSLDRVTMPAAQAASGREGIVEGVDYRGVLVVAALRSVPDSPWSLVARMDTAEVYAPLRAQLWQVAVMVVVLLFGAGAFVGLVWRHQRARSYRERYKSAEALAFSELRYRRLFEAAKDGILILDAETGMVVDVNPFLVELLGSSREIFLGKKVWELGFFKDIVANQDKFAELKQKEYIRYEDKPLETSDGRRIEVEFVSNIYLVDDRKVIQCNIRDITERNRVEEAARASELLLRQVMDLVPHHIFAKDRHGRFLFLNRAAADACGHRPREMVGRLERELRPDKAHVEKFLRDDQEIIASGKPKFIPEEPITYADGRIHFLQTTKMPFTPRGSAEQGVLGVAVDITERKQVDAALAAANERLRNTLAQIAQGYYALDRNWRVVDVNDVAEKHFGKTAAELIGGTFEQATQGRIPDNAREGIKQVMASGQPQHFEVESKVRPGTWALDYIYPRDGGVEVYFTDITERKRVEETLRQSEEYFRTMFEVASIGMAKADPRTGQFVRVNRKMTEITGYSVEEMLQMHVPDLTHPDDRQRDWEAFQRVVRGEAPDYRMEKRYVRKDGAVIWVNVNMTVIRDAAGQPIRTMAAIEDITERKRVEETLRGNENMLRLLMDSTAEGILGLDMDGKFTFCNATSLRMLGYVQARDLVGKNMHTLIHHSHADGTPLSEDDSGIHRSFRKGSGTHADDQVYWRVNGSCFPVEYWSYPMWHNGKAIGAVVAFFDITERRRAQETQNRLVTAVEQIAEIVMITDARAAILYANPAFEKITGYSCEEVIGQNPRILKSGKHDAEFYRQMWAVLTHGEVWSGRFINKRKDGTLYEEEATISPVRDRAKNIVNYVAVKRDVTQEVAMEAQLRQAQKMEAIGTLAGGVAHEINNPINGIMNYAQLLTDGLPADSPLLKFSTNILKETNRVSEIVRNLLAFARQDKQGRSPASLNDIIKSVLTLVQSVIRHDQITLTVEVPEGLPQMECRSQQLEQVLLNLLTNARDALNEKYPAYHEDKIIHVTACLFERDGSRWIRTTVEDHANGIPEGIRDRILDPFFTTKIAGKGTGLGLSISHGIVKEHGGELNFETETGRGTRFHMDLPVKGGK